MIQDIIYFTENNNLPGIILAIDFQKAFDSIEWSFIKQALSKYNFGPSFIKWFDLFYTNISSCVINNGVTSQYFTIQRGVRQGDPLSPYLFILSIELLACAIKNDQSITGININGKSYKINLYADDLTLTLANFQSVNNVINLLYEFKRYSGLEINKEKSEGMTIGSMKRLKYKQHNISFDNQFIKILGVWLSNNPHEIVLQNFQVKVESLIRQLHWWKARDLSLKGRVLIVKSLGLSKFQYLASVLSVPQTIISQVNSLIYEFIWNGKTDKVKRSIFEQQYNRGGYKMVNFKDIIQSSAIMWIKKYLDSTERLWKNSFEYFCQKKNLNIFIQSNFELSELPKNIPTYYHDILASFAELSYQRAGNNTNTYLWYNRDIKLGGKSVYNGNLFSIGMWTISDLFIGESIIPFNTWLQRGAREMDRLLWGGIVNIVKSKHHLPHPNSVPPCGIVFGNECLSMQKVTQKHIKTLLANYKYNKLNEGNEKYKSKAVHLYGNIHQDDWENIFSAVHNAPVDNKTKDIQYKLLMRFLPTNHLLYKMKKINSPTCNFCMLEQQTLEHLFFYCVLVKSIWYNVLGEWKKTREPKALSLRTCMLGIFNLQDEYDVSFNAVILIVKSYIMQCKYQENNLNVIEFGFFFKNRVKLWKKAYTSKCLDILSTMY